MVPPPVTVPLVAEGEHSGSTTASEDSGLIAGEINEIIPTRSATIRVRAARLRVRPLVL